MSFKTEQEAFWAGEFGTKYIERNKGDILKAANIDFFAKALSNTRGLQSCIEFGANIGMNINALKLLYPELDAHAIEINKNAAIQLREVIESANVYECSILDFVPTRMWDLVLVKGVLIHIEPSMLPQVYEKLVASCGRFLLVAEYYNPVPVSISYRGHNERLFKRDFAGEILENYPQMELVDYGFVYRRDPNFPQDDLTWFLLEKSAAVLE
ncbi:pseudaminic acid biosynthesis-associated methylase [Seongchinamella sediminis]|uniref:Pseudaminic acid biosynthesis-associated methylase n=1 Tax=Seongchinamella sediminis TaxID=2283635 RepID=A0A3L7DZX8_9GAMM|nr:pseudaminic acid biosynthesis-associated methylase [Seongchinamella sediminis]RLQ22219.1 pseudaminic acid biosynthesis-associated methylase [Seongchinamella sediminis]